MTNKNPKAIIDQLSPEEADLVLKTLAESDSELAERIAHIALDHISEVSPDEVAVVVYEELNALEVEEVWDRAGATRDGYVETEEVADEMIQRVLAPYIEELTRYQELDIQREAISLCMGILKGLYQFETESSNEFKDWAVDLPQIYADAVLEQWYTKEMSPEVILEVQSFIVNHLPRWSESLNRSFSSLKARNR